MSEFYDEISPDTRSESSAAVDAAVAAVVSPVDTSFPRAHNKTKCSLTSVCREVLPQEYARAQEVRGRVNEEDEEEYINCLFSESVLENEAAFLQRTEELISLRTNLLHNPASPFIITPYVPLNILSKKSVFSGTIMHNIFWRRPWRMEIANDRTYREIDLLSGEIVTEGLMTDPGCLMSPARHEGKKILYVGEKETYYHENELSIVMPKNSHAHSPVFQREKDGRVSSYSEHDHFLCNGILYVKKYLGRMGGSSVVQVYPKSHPELKETFLLKSRSSQIFVHACEWYECYRSSILHVRSMRKEETDKQCGLIKLASYYKGHLLLVLMNGVTVLLTLG